jgi:hypothetical protein
MSVPLDARDAILAVGRELTKGNSCLPALRRWESRRLFRRKLDNRRTWPDSESGQAFLICEFFTLDHAPTLQLGKSSSVPFSALNNQTHLDQFRLARPLSKKSEKQLLLATQNTSS